MTPTQADRDEAHYLAGKLAMDLGITLTGDAVAALFYASFTRHRVAAEAAAFEKAAGVAEEQTRLNVQARIDRADDDLAFQFQGLGNVIATAIRKLAGEKHD